MSEMHFLPILNSVGVSEAKGSLDDISLQDISEDSTLNAYFWLQLVS